MADKKRHNKLNGMASDQPNSENGTHSTAGVTNEKLKSTTDGWKVKASSGAMSTSNPIREVIETMNLSENPNKKVIPLSIGDPTIFGNLKPCKEIVEAIRRAEQSGKFYGYQIAAGLESARDAVANYHLKCTGIKVKPQDVILASGCSHAIDLCICVLAQQGQNILIPRPGFPLYKTLTSVYGVKYKQYNLLADKNWSVDLKHLESLIDENTAAIVVNNPSNPCGSVFSEDHLIEILELAERHRLPIIADEIYDKLVFSQELYTSRPRALSVSSSRSSSSSTASEIDDEAHLLHDLKGRNKLKSKQRIANDENRQPEEMIKQDLMAKYRGDQDRLEADDSSDFQHVPFKYLAELSETVPILTCGGISKTCLIPGVRLGWIIINDKGNIFDQSVRQGLGRLTQRLMGPNSLIQGALKDILNNVPDQFYRQTMEFIFKNAKLCYQRLKQIRGLKPFMPQGSMYLMVRFDPQTFPSIIGDLDFTSKLMNEESVLVLPGSCFDFPNYFRICLTVPTNIMDEALNRIEDFCQRRAIPTRSIMAATMTSIGAEISDKKANLVSDQLQLQLPLKQHVNTTRTKHHPSKQTIVGPKKMTLTLKSPFEWNAPNNNIGSQKT